MSRHTVPDPPPGQVIAVRAVLSGVSAGERIEVLAQAIVEEASTAIQAERRDLIDYLSEALAAVEAV